MTKREPGLTVVQEPEQGSVGIAGLGVRYRPEARESDDRTTLASR